MSRLYVPVTLLLVALLLTRWAVLPLLPRVYGPAAAVDAIDEIGKSMQPIWDTSAATHLPVPWLKLPPPRRLNPLDCRPQLLLIGTQKGGTTSFRAYNFQQHFHPAILMHPKKEGWYFQASIVPYNFSGYVRSFPGLAPDDDPLAGRCSQVAQFNLTPDSAPLFVRGEVTPGYLYHPWVPEWVLRLLPDARLVVILREPASRMVSQLNMDLTVSRKAAERELAKGPVAAGSPSPPPPNSKLELQKQKQFGLYFLQQLNATVEAQLAALQPCYDRVLREGSTQELVQAQVLRCLEDRLGGNNGSRLIADTLFSHVWRGVYVDQLEVWLQHFPPSQLLLWFSEDFKATPDAHMRQLVEWLGLDPTHISPGVVLEEANIIYHAAPTPEHVVKKLQDFYRPHNARLARLLHKHGFEAHARRMQRLWAYGAEGDRPAAATSA